MRILPLLLLLSCAGIPVNIENNCGLTLAGDWDNRFGESWLTANDANKTVFNVIDAATFTTDFTLMDQTDNCQAMVGYRVYTKREATWKDWTGDIAGFTDCWSKVIVINTPEVLRVENSSLAHELFHVMQHCEARKPVDKYTDEDHANWYRDGIFHAIDMANK